MNQINFPLRTSKGLLSDNMEMITYFTNLSIQELITELDYSRTSKNYDLELIVVDEYYRKQAIKNLN
ncbi:hypothetical protein ABLU29_06340 [Lactococcus lactis]|uniref:hypothetical protein n=1 Tax=Lactococcus lactis TaxID=1358 RepID=UPI003877AF09